MVARLLAREEGRRRLPRRAWSILLGCVLGLLALEALLQIASYIAWQGHASPGADGPGSSEPGGVLCVGDSLTFGLGVERSETYPMRLAAGLPGRGVVNAGIPGQDSRDVLARIDGLLERHRPTQVCLLVGWNDTWSRPAEMLHAESGTERFPWRWRTWRLLELALAEDALEPEASELAFLGAWHVGEHTVRLAADGTGALGEVPVRWRCVGPLLQIAMADGTTLAVRWRVAEGAIEFALPGWDRFQRARPGPPRAITGRIEVEDALKRRDLPAAQQALPRVAASERTHAQVLVAVALLDAQRHAQADAMFGELEQRWREHQDVAAGSGVAWWHLCRGRTATACELAERLLGLGGGVRCWRVLIDSADGPRRERLARDLCAALALEPSAWRRAEMRLELAVCIAPQDAGACMAEVVQAVRSGAGPDEVVAALQRAVEHGSVAEELLLHAQAAEAKTGDLAGLVRSVRRATTSEEAVWHVLERHTRSLVESCQRRGARVLLVGYPFELPGHEAVLRRVANDLRVRLVEVLPAFTEVLATSPRSDWFVDDIHCSAKGYALMAQIVGEAVRQD